MVSDSSSKPPIAEALKHFYGIDVRVDRQGYQKILCPLHPDTSPSASVSVERQRWSCFVCRVSEDSYALIMREKNCGFLEAQEFARTRFGGDSEAVPRELPGESGRGVHSRSRTGRRSGQVRSGLRPFGSTWS
ncbi:CHC2 zinc finger domain-containing protein [Streptomyces wuyuanensis]|uniref:CHC2 zinc finger domain-containing protein n=1 Tax=Streptomyces wuyuanensis TaxID=1196353 RepID=UPI003417C08D